MLGCNVIRSTTLTTRTRKSGQYWRSMSTAARVSSVGTSPQQAMTTSTEPPSSVLAHGLGLVPPVAAVWLDYNLANSIVINIVLCVFNMLPLPPLDGGRVAVGLLPNALALPLARLERYGMLILLLFLFVIPFVGEKIGINLNILGWVIGGPADALYKFVLLITGQSG